MIGFSIHNHSYLTILIARLTAGFRNWKTYLRVFGFGRILNGKRFRCFGHALTNPVAEQVLLVDPSSGVEVSADRRTVTFISDLSASECETHLWPFAARSLHWRTRNANVSSCSCKSLRNAARRWSTCAEL